MPKRLRRSCRALVRNYLYQGKKIDQQVHLGYDLSSNPTGPCEARTSRGESGTTGKAGGDRVHFSMQLEGIQTDPKECGGMPTWIQDQVAKRVSFTLLPHQ